MNVTLMDLDSCALCRRRLDTFGREVYLRVDGRARIVGYACQPCVRNLEFELRTGRPAGVGSDAFYADWAEDHDS